MLERDFRGQRGFTLLELVVALAVSSVLALGGAAALSTSIDVYQRISRRTNEAENFRAIDRLIKVEWAGRGQTVRSNGRVLEFDTLHATDFERVSNPSRLSIKYACEVGATGTYHFRYEAVTLPIQAPGSEPRPQAPQNETQVLADGLRECSFTFLTAVRSSEGQARPAWTSSWNATNPAPALLQLSMWGDGGRRPATVYPARTVYPR